MLRKPPNLLWHLKKTKTKTKRKENKNFFPNYWRTAFAPSLSKYWEILIFKSICLCINLTFVLSSSENNFFFLQKISLTLSLDILKIFSLNKIILC
jgi:hypothetical protein